MVEFNDPDEMIYDEQTSVNSCRKAGTRFCHFVWSIYLFYVLSKVDPVDSANLPYLREPQVHFLHKAVAFKWPKYNCSKRIIENQRKTGN